MMKKILLIVMVFTSIIINGQSKIDSLKVVADNLKNQKLDIENKIETIEKQIVTEILEKGYEITIKVSSYRKALDIRDKVSGGEIIASIKNGEKLLVLGIESIYYKVKIDDKVGYVYISNAEYPISLLEKFKYSDLIDKYKKGYKPSEYKSSTKSSRTSSYKTSSRCSTTQCSGRTKKGRRCRNRTKNCSGRCYRH